MIFHRQQIFSSFIVIFSHHKSELRMNFSAPKHGRGPEPQLLPDLQQAVHERRDADGTHEVCPQGPQRVRRAR